MQNRPSLAPSSKIDWVSPNQKTRVTSDCNMPLQSLKFDVQVLLRATKTIEDNKFLFCIVAQQLLGVSVQALLRA